MASADLMPIGPDLERSVRDRAREIRDRADEALRRELVDAAPQSTPNPGSLRTPGALKASIRTDTYERGDVYGTTARAEADYAEFVDKGTRPHLIKPTRARILRFWSEEHARIVYRPLVYHPGTRAQPFFTDTVGRWARILEDAAR